MNKLYSNLKIFKHPNKLLSIKDGNVTPPIMVRIKPTNVCDQKCYYCSTPVKATYVKNASDEFKYNDYLPWRIMKSLLDDLYNMGVKSVILSGGGEPLVYKYIEDTLRLIREYGFDYALITNGWKLKGDIAKLLDDASWVRISADSSSLKNYSNIRNIRDNALLDIFKNIREFNKIRRGHFGINYVVHKRNYKEVLDSAATYKCLGVDNIKFAPLIDKNLDVGYHKNIKDDVSLQIKKAQDMYNSDTFQVIDRYTSPLDTSVVFKRDYSRCPMIQIVSSVAANGKVYLCHDKAYMRGFDIGNLHKDRFKDIWMSKDTERIFKTFDAKKKCKHHCVWDSRNRIINEYMNMGDDNFI